VGILNAWTTNVRMNRARITAMTIDSKYSRTVDLRRGPGAAGAGAADGFEAVVFCFFTADP
jgi:hypothetical protein